MAQRKCSLCSQLYTDEKGHNYDICVSRCFDQLEEAKKEAHKGVDRLINAYSHVSQALSIQKQDWWKKSSPNG